MEPPEAEDSSGSCTFDLLCRLLAKEWDGPGSAGNYGGAMAAFGRDSSDLQNLGSTAGSSASTDRPRRPHPAISVARSKLSHSTSV